MKEIKLKNGKNLLVSDCDFEHLSSFLISKNGRKEYSIMAKLPHSKVKALNLKYHILGISSMNGILVFNKNGIPEDMQRENLVVIFQSDWNRIKLLSEKNPKDIILEPNGMFYMKSKFHEKLIGPLISVEETKQLLRTKSLIESPTS